MENKQPVYQDYSYEKAIAELENILAKMDEGEVPLAESMEHFETGMKLVARCEEILNSYERRITKIVEERNGQFREEPMEQD